MKGEVIKIKFWKDTVSLSDGNQMKINELFSKDNFMAKQFSHSETFLEVKILNYSPVENELYVEILSYNRDVCDFSLNQDQLSNKLSYIKSISLRSSDTFKILAMFREGHENTYSSKHREEKYIERNKESDIIHNIPIVEKIEPKPIQEEELEIKPQKVVVSEIIQIPFKKLSFEFGCVSFKKWIQELEKEIKFEIINYNVREEYDAIKNYFSNVLKTKKITVSINLTAIDGIINNVSVKSKEIDKIDNKLIDNVKFEFVRKTKKKIDIEIDKSIFTMDEYFDTFSDEKFKSNTFYSNETDFFDDLLKISNTKHYKNLRFLSSKHAHKIMKLRFVHKPFSFIFLIEGDRDYHIIWETLDTKEATYVWHLEKNLDVLKRTIKKLEDIINTIKVEGKIAYINYNEDKFERIYHDYSEIVDGFVKWKGELESKLT
jgi:hypothetical protein